jgi:hypothetical protein
VIRRRALGYAAAWLLAGALAITVGVMAVQGAGAGVRDRGWLGSAGAGPGDVALTPTPDPTAERVERAIEGEYGGFVVACRGSVAYGAEARPDAAAGWRIVSFERGPDDDVDAVFASGPRSVEIEVFCNRGRPTVSDLEEHVLAQD